MSTTDYCREIETYLCQKNDGHLVRVVGPSFEIVSRWAADGVPLKVACRGIDRYFERYYRKGPRRRPVRIDFCEADVLEVFDEWRRALGLTTGNAGPSEVGHTADVVPSFDSGAGSGTDSGADSGGGSGARAAAPRRGPSLPAHLERVVMRLTGARATGRLGGEADQLIDRVSHELDAARSSTQGLRGEARRALIDRLDALDAELLKVVRLTLDETQQQALQDEAETELADFRASMAPEAYDRVRQAAIDRLVRDRFGLPTVSF